MLTKSGKALLTECYLWGSWRTPAYGNKLILFSLTNVFNYQPSPSSLTPEYIWNPSIFLHLKFTVLVWPSQSLPWQLADFSHMYSCHVNNSYCNNKVSQTTYTSTPGMCGENPSMTFHNFYVRVLMVTSQCLQSLHNLSLLLLYSHSLPCSSNLILQTVLFLSFEMLRPNVMVNFTCQLGRAIVPR